MLKNKIYILLFTFIVFAFLLSPICFASTDDTGNVYNLPAYPEELNEYNHYVVIRSTIREKFYLIPFNETFEIIDNSSTRFNILVDSKNYYEFYWSCSFDSEIPDSWEASGTSLGHSGGYFSKTNNPHYVVDSCPCFSSYQNNLQESIDEKNSFFLNRQEILVPIMEKAPLAKVMEEVLAILPVILMTIVGLIGLRKVLRFLSKVLHRS